MEQYRFLCLADKYTRARTHTMTHDACTWKKTYTQVQEYKSRKQLLGVQGACSWVIVRKKQAVREVFQKVPPGVGWTTNTVLGGHEDADDLEPEEDSQQSGPDAGGGEVDGVLPGGEWAVVASSPNYTMEQVDQER